MNNNGQGEDLTGAVDLSELKSKETFNTRSIRRVNVLHHGAQVADTFAYFGKNEHGILVRPIQKHELTDELFVDMTREPMVMTASGIKWYIVFNEKAELGVKTSE